VDKEDKEDFSNDEENSVDETHGKKRGRNSQDSTKKK
jgi:hypothetical protein